MSAEKVSQLASRLDESLDVALLDFPKKYETYEEWTELESRIGGEESVVQAVFGVYEGDSYARETQSPYTPTDFVFLAVKLETKYLRTQLSIETALGKLEAQDSLSAADQRLQTLLVRLRERVVTEVDRLDALGERWAAKLQGETQNEALAQLRESMELAPQAAQLSEQIRQKADEVKALFDQVTEDLGQRFYGEIFGGGLNLEQNILLEVILDGNSSRLDQAVGQNFIEEEGEKASVETLQNFFEVLTPQSIGTLEHILEVLTKGADSLRDSIAHYEVEQQRAEVEQYFASLQTSISQYADPSERLSEADRIKIQGWIRQLEGVAGQPSFASYTGGSAKIATLRQELQDLLDRQLPIPETNSQSTSDPEVREITNADIIREIFTNGIEKHVPSFITVSNPRIVSGNLMYTSKIHITKVPRETRRAYMKASDKDAWSASQIRIPVRGFRRVTKNDISTRNTTTQVTLRPASGYTLERICRELIEQRSGK